MTVKRLILFVLLASTVSCIGLPRTSDSPGAVAVERSRTAWRRSLPYLDSGLAKIGRSRASIELPQGYECSYNMIGRVPLVDESMRNPLAMPFVAADLAEDVSKYRDSTAAVIRAAAKTLGAPVKEETVDFSAGKSLREVLHATASEEEIRAFEECLRPETAGALAELVSAMRRAANMRTEALSRLTDEEHKSIVNACRSFFLTPLVGGGVELKVLTAPVEEKLAVAEIARKIRIDRLVEAAALVAETVDRLRPIFRRLEPEQKTVVLPTMFGAIVVGGTGDDLHDAVDAAILIDFGGNDRYTGGAGSSANVPGGISVCIDLAGDDFYDAPERDFCQGSGVAGVGILVDESGNDRYRAGQYGQGCGFIGVGALVDGGGNDEYVGKLGNQASGIFGAGILMDLNGNDVYRVDVMGQGFSSTMGVGLLCEYDGNDTYTAGGSHRYINDCFMSFAQGFSCGTRGYPWNNTLTLYGGVGALVDLRGDDIYTVGAYGQGAAYVFGLGLLFEADGKDVYHADDFSTGSGTHLATGVFVDVRGDDTYNGKGHSLAWSLDRSQAVFLDVEGNDSYHGTGCAYSGKPKSVGFFVDAAGDDNYASGHFGDVRPSEKPYLWPVAVFVDLGGNDTYAKKAIGNEQSWVMNGGGVGIDTSAGAEVGDAILLEEGRDDDALAHPEIASDNIFVRYAGEGLYLGAPPNQIARLFISGKRSVRRAAEDITMAQYLSKNIDEKWIRPLGRAALVSRDPETRRFLAEFLGLFDQREAFEYLRKILLNDDHPLVLSYAIMALARRDPEATVESVASLSSSRDLLLRRSVARALGATQSPKAYGFLKSLSTDADPGVRSVAADALSLSPEDRAEETLLDLLRDEDGYVRESAAYALVAHGNAAGVGELIKVLRHPNWVTADGAHKMLTQTTNQSFPSKDVAAWERWWEENRESFSLDRYVKIKDILITARRAYYDRRYEDAIRAYEKALEIWPDHHLTVERSAQAFNGYAWDLVTRREGDRDPAKAVGLAMRALALLPDDLAILDTLAEAHAQMGEWERAIDVRKRMTDLAPDNEVFRRRLESVRQRKEPQKEDRRKDGNP